MIEFWAAALALTLVLYVLLDGFDLGIGMLFGFAPNENARRHMMQAIAPVWDGNETWLVLAATILFGAFPVAYALLLSAFYLPLIVMLGSLILRGVAFEFRYKSRRLRAVWDTGFICGSYVATFAQGVTIGTLVQELPIQNGQYVGGSFGWLSPFSVLCGVGLCLGYSMLGAAWLCGKTENDVRDYGFRMLPRLLVGVLVFLGAAFGIALALQLRVLDRWGQQPEMVILPVIGALACAGLFYAAWRRIDALPFPLAATIFAAAFVTLAVSFLPYMVPFSITIAEAASPPSSLEFMFWGAGIIVLPITVIYTLVIYRVFKGKVQLADDYD